MNAKNNLKTIALLIHQDNFTAAERKLERLVGQHYPVDGKYKKAAEELYAWI